MKLKKEHSIWEKWLDLKDECRRRKINKDIINKFEKLLLMERERLFIFQKLKENGK